MASSQPATLRERKKAQTRAQILEAAQELIVERGYESTTMDEVAAQADVSRGTVFNYFPRKDAFLEAWIQARRAVIAELFEREQGQAVTTAERLRHALLALAELLESDVETNRAITRAWVVAGGQLRPGASATADLFADTIRYGQAQGDVRDDLDAAHVARVLLDAYSGALVRWAGPETDVSLREAVTTVLEVILDGLISDTS
jgi:AcrR family transcriptional regulator